LAAHKIILVNSKFFADKLARDPLREKISVKDYNAEVVFNVLKFLYEGQIDVDSQQIVEVSKFAKDTGDQQLEVSRNAVGLNSYPSDSFCDCFRRTARPN